MSNHVETSQRAGFMVRETTVYLESSLGSLDSVTSVFYTWMQQGIFSVFPITSNEFQDYCRSLVAYKINSVASRVGVPVPLRYAVMPSFLEHFIARIGDWRDESTGVNIRWSKVEDPVLAVEDIAAISRNLASIRKTNVNLSFDAFDSRSISQIDNAYIVDDGHVYSVHGGDPRGYQMAAALNVSPVDSGQAELFRFNLCSVNFALQEVVNAFE